MTYTDVTNAKRAAWAEAAIHLFTQLTGCDREDALPDLLANLMHWAGQNEFDFAAALERGKWHFDEECVDEEVIALTACAPDLADALRDIQRMAAMHADYGADARARLRLIEQRAIQVLALAKGAGQ